MLPMMAMRYPQGTLAFLHTELHIDARQTSQWENFAAALTDNTQQMQQQMQSRRHGWSTGQRSEDLPAMLMRREAMTKMRLAMMQRMDGALIPFYQSLDPQQKQTADQLFLGCRAGAGRGHGKGPHRPM